MVIMMMITTHLNSFKLSHREEFRLRLNFFAVFFKQRFAMQQALIIIMMMMMINLYLAYTIIFQGQIKSCRISNTNITH